MSSKPKETKICTHWILWSTPTKCNESKKKKNWRFFDFFSFRFNTRDKFSFHFVWYYLIFTLYFTSWNSPNNVWSSRTRFDSLVTQQTWRTLELFKNFVIYNFRYYEKYFRKICYSRSVNQTSSVVFLSHITKTLSERTRKWYQSHYQSGSQWWWWMGSSDQFSLDDFHYKGNNRIQWTSKERKLS